MTRHTTRTHLHHISKLIDNAHDKRAKEQLTRTYNLLINKLLKAGTGETEHN